MDEEYLQYIFDFQEAPKQDRTGHVCEECHKGSYAETSLQDDWYGTLHCTECGHEVKRWG